MPRPFAAPVPVTPVFLDLPLMTGTEDPQAPHLAVTATPWPGTVAVYSSIEDEGYTLNATLSVRAVIGETLSTLPAARPGLWDRGPALRVQMAGGDLESVSMAQLLAIGDGSAEGWELLQFATATPVLSNTWDLSLRLRGQLGTDALIPEVWPAGSTVVLLDEAPEQIALAASARGLARHYRIGSARRGYDDPSYVHEVLAFRGAGLRPLSPCHLRAGRGGAGCSASTRSSCLREVLPLRLPGRSAEVTSSSFFGLSALGVDLSDRVDRLLAGSASSEGVAFSPARPSSPRATRCSARRASRPRSPACARTGWKTPRR